MRWTVEGADKGTGTEVVISIDADGEGEAREKAAAKGLLVSSVHRSTADVDLEEASARVPTLPYRGPAGGNGRPGRPAVQVETADPWGISDDALWLRALAALLGGFGWVAMLGGVVCVIAALAGSRGNLSEQLANTLNVYAGLSGILAGLLLLGFAQGMRMLASIGRAVADMARGSK